MEMSRFSGRLLLIAGVMALLVADAAPSSAQASRRSQVLSPEARAEAARQRARNFLKPAQPPASLGQKPGQQSYGQDPLGRFYGKDPVKALYGEDPLKKLYGRANVEALYGRDPVKALGLPPNRVPKPPTQAAPEPGPTLEQAERFQSLDRDGNGYISRGEYVGAGRHVGASGPRQRMAARRAARFAGADTNRDGRVSVEELSGAANPRF